MVEESCSRNKDQQNVEKHMRKWIRKRKLELNSCSKAGGESILLSLNPPWAIILALLVYTTIVTIIIILLIALKEGAVREFYNLLTAL